MRRCVVAAVDAARYFDFPLVMTDITIRHGDTHAVDAMRVYPRVSARVRDEWCRALPAGPRTESIGRIAGNEACVRRRASSRRPDVQSGLHYRTSYSFENSFVFNRPCESYRRAICRPLLSSRLPRLRGAWYAHSSPVIRFGVDACVAQTAGFSLYRSLVDAFGCFAASTCFCFAASARRWAADMQRPLVARRRFPQRFFQRNPSR